MKKNLFKILITSIVLISSFQNQQLKAASLVAGALEPTQILNNIQLLLVDASSAATQINTYLTQVKQTILDPIGDGLLTMAQLQSADSILNMITGNGQGNSLIISDPQKYFDSKGLEVVKRSLGILSQQNGSYGDTIYGSVISSFKQNSLANDLKQINQSNLPTILQSKICTDASLTDIATKDVRSSDGEGGDSIAVIARKKELYDSLCVGNPQTDTTLANTLLSVDQQRPEIGGWDKWLAVTTGGENNYTRAINTNLRIAKEKDAAVQLATNDFNNGRGTISQTECIEYEVYDGQEYCVQSQITNPAGLISDSLTKAVNSGLERLTAIQGDSGWSSAASLIASVKGILNGVNAIKNTAGQINGSISKIDYALGGGTNYATTPNTSNTTVVSSAPKNNLANDPQGKESILKPIKNLIATNIGFMNDLDQASRDQLAIIQPYEIRVKAMKACYDEVDRNNQNAINAYNFRMNKIQDGYKKIDSNFLSVSAVKKVSEDTLKKLDASFSSEEISNIFSSYQSQISASNMPDYRMVAEYKGQYIKDKSTIDADTGANGELTGLQRECERIREEKNSQGA